jgi:hypothetical protein
VAHGPPDKYQGISRLWQVHSPIPLTASPSIIIDNALTINWEVAVSKEKLSYILGNPPFLGARIMEPG